MKEAPPGFEPGMADLQSASESSQLTETIGTSENDSERLAYTLALLVKESPDLALLIETWDSIPDAVRAGIIAMVKASAAPVKG